MNNTLHRTLCWSFALSNERTISSWTVKIEHQIRVLTKREGKNLREDWLPWESIGRESSKDGSSRVGRDTSWSRDFIKILANFLIAIFFNTATPCRDLAPQISLKNANIGGDRRLEPSKSHTKVKGGDKLRLLYQRYVKWPKF